MYRGWDGLKCAAGVLITDDHYRPELECNSVTEERVMAALNASGVGPDDLDLVQHLQCVHDEEPVADWPKAFERLAFDYGLPLSDLTKSELAQCD
jgi:hypothetical protein